ncbi:BTAD domain-containing putative transcriptional regulator [Streptomyces sp. NPDC059017]|uniref:AfsR/SARP family transcriptional regulator n=1 Tax=Streptomyces sp. NPDC059017 TaxID=3346700 RepID=UPI00368428E5
MSVQVVQCTAGGLYCPWCTRRRGAVRPSCRNARGRSPRPHRLPQGAQPTCRSFRHSGNRAEHRRDRELHPHPDRTSRQPDGVRLADLRRGSRPTAGPGAAGRSCQGHPGPSAPVAPASGPRKHGVPPVRDRDRAGWLPLGCAKRPDGRGPTEGTVEEARGARDSGDLAAAVGAWSAALNLFHGEPLSAIPDRFAEAERLRLSEYRHVVVRDKVRRQLRLGRHAEVVAELALSATHPHNESVAALLMRALYAANRQAYALAGFVKVRRRLVEEQRAEPGR